MSPFEKKIERAIRGRYLKQDGIPEECECDFDYARLAHDLVLAFDAAACAMTEAYGMQWMSKHSKAARAHQREAIRSLEETRAKWVAP